MQVRGFKHNPRTCPNWTLDPCQERGLLASHGRFHGNQWAPRPTHSSSLCSSDGRSQLPSKLEIWPRHYPLGVRGCKWAVSAHPDYGSQKSTIDPSSGPYEGRGAAANPVLFEYKLPRGPMQLGSPRFPGILAPWGRHVGSGCQNQQNRPSRVADQGWLLWRSRQAKP